jgi:hypothetical protein
MSDGRKERNEGKDEHDRSRGAEASKVVGVRRAGEVGGNGGREGRGKEEGEDESRRNPERTLRWGKVSRIRCRGRMKRTVEVGNASKNLRDVVLTRDEGLVASSENRQSVDVEPTGI